MAQGTRTRRVAERVRTELSVLLARSVRDPGLLGVTVTEVRMTADLLLARVYYTVLDGSDRRRAARGLRRAPPCRRRAVGQRLQLREGPELRVLYDDYAGQQDRDADQFGEIERESGSPGGRSDAAGRRAETEEADVA